MLRMAEFDGWLSAGNDIMDGKRETVGGTAMAIETEGGAVIVWQWIRR
jgi:hypothetical protein